MYRQAAGDFGAIDDGVGGGGRGAGWRSGGRGLRRPHPGASGAHILPLRERRGRATRDKGEGKCGLKR
jgi:hypothetical protein